MSESLEFSKNLEVTETNIPGLVVVDLPVHGDSRGWFKENWQREKMVGLGLPDFKPVQNNISFNAEKGVTRGIHAEPWDKYVSVAAGRIFGAWVDLREGETFGQKFTAEIDPTKAVFVPRGVGNAFQALEDNTAYTYLVTDHWSQEAVPLYTFLNLGDEQSSIEWPIPLEQAELSDKDKAHPQLAEVVPMKPPKVLIAGANGQLGMALRKLYPEAEFVDREEFDLTNPEAYKAKNWRQYSCIINAAAYTAVDNAETPEGRELAWNINARAVQLLAKVAIENDVTLVHISSDYVFDGTKEVHTEDELFAPLGVYGQSKAAGDIAAALAQKHYILRTSWVIGEGNNFVKTMKSLADKGVKPSVVDDQIGRLTFTKTLADGIKHLVDTKAPYGTYNLTNEGDSVSWADIAKLTYEKSGASADDVTGVTTEDYYAGKENISPRPLQSTMDLTKIKSTGFQPTDWRTELDNYMQQL
jgi:dTDP-4-dehydrorhamnose 3,5-epimerase/reductase